MENTRSLLELAAVDLARELVYRFLAAALTDPRAPGWRLVLDVENQRLACEAADLLRLEAAARPIELGFGEFPPDLLTLKPLCGQMQYPRDEKRDAYDDVFGLVYSRECPPCETEYHPASETFYRSQQLADIAGFYQAFGLETSTSFPERPDHVALELEFMSFLLMKKRLAEASADSNPLAQEQARVCDQASRNFFTAHLVWWLPAFTAGLRRKAPSGFYAEVGRALAAFLPFERSWQNVPLQRLPLQPAFIERPEEQAGCASCPAQT
jgi:TorA maturation chaperone TorD